ncbi:hypothetical protein [Stackebrandtia nassauensis]|uniref:hypothetical protein n=1 Tax=Stackebrandtia nassauensis TaxID=283811 RepID=UPI001187295C|nr:hypothetical protein [Stackebrandtia nassauensis]
MPEDIDDLTAEERLESILWEERVRGFATFSRLDGPRMVCFSEAPLLHLNWFFQDKKWPQWGLIFSRQQVYDVGGGPVWHLRGTEIDRLNPELRHWAVRLEVGPARRSDWLHEREWRIPLPDGSEAISLTTFTPDRSEESLPLALKLEAILIATADWQPSERWEDVETGHFLNEGGGGYVTPDYHGAIPETISAPLLPILWEKTVRVMWDFDRKTFVKVDDTGHAH